MLSVLIYHLLISFLCINAGFLFNKLFTFCYKDLDANEIIFCLFNGLILLTAISQLGALFFPINIITVTPVFIVLQAVSLLKFKDFKQFLLNIVNEIKSLHPIIKLSIAATWVLLLLLNAGPTLMDDTESYHIQMVKWLQQYGTVPGIANLHNRFGFNSSWFSSIATFTFPSNYNYYTVLNGTISVWLIFYLWKQIDISLQSANCNKKILKSFGCLLLLSFSLGIWSLLRSNVSNANYDFITAAMVVILFIELLANTHHQIEKQRYIEWLIWPIYLFSVRVINYPLLLLTFSALIIVYKKTESKKAFLYLFVLYSLFLILPFLTRNVMLSGYLFYPSIYFNWFEVDWKVDESVTHKLLYFIKYFNRVNTAFQNIEITAQLKFPFWTKVWYTHLFTYDKIILITSFTGYFSALVFYKQLLLKNNLMPIFLLAILIQIISWFFIAPDPRFIYGIFLCGIFLFILPILSFLKVFPIQKLTFIISGILILFSVCLFVNKIKNDSRYRNWLIAYELPRPPVQKVIVDKTELYIPEKILANWNNRCYATKLPCLYEVNPSLHLRGQTIKEGFFIR